MPQVSSIKVGVRCRPLAFNELNYGCQSCVGFPGGNEIIIGGTKQFNFDHVFSDQATQEEIYKNSVNDMINNLFLGYNVTVLAYGQTGSGKTFTMGTNFTDKTITQNSGVIPRAIKDIYDYIDPIKAKSNVCVKVSFIEVYNEEIFDLLSNNKEIKCIREENQDVKIPNLIEQVVNSSEDIFKCLTKGSENRAVGSTAMNETSSRSHAIFTIYISILPLPDAAGDNTFEPISTKLHLVDLAGSERASKTQATGDRFKEGVNINRGLLALGNVISSLVEKDKNKNKNQHIPYRESKLTRLLQDSLGGNSKTLMLACISPADSNFEETSTTLNYAARARQIQNKPIINKVDSVQGEVYQLRAQVTALQAQLKNIKGNGNESTSLLPSTITTSYSNQIYELNAQIVAIQRQKFDLIEEFDEELSKKDDLLKRVWDKINTPSCEKDELYNELEKHVMGLISKEDNIEYLEQSIIADQDETKPESKEKTDFLKCLREELKNKEAHLQQIENADNSILHQYEERNRELLQRIKELEDERSSVVAVKRQDDIEIRLKEAKRQLSELNILKKEKEQNSNEVKQLKLKIDELKKSICKVSKELQKEKSQFRKITMEKERQYKTLVNKDRLLQTQMERQAVQHAKETAVLKRKVESCMAEGKRLKHILENQKKTSNSRIVRNNMNKNINGQVKLWIRQSLEHAAQRCETRQRFNLLIEDRRKLTEQLNQLSYSEGDEKYQLESEIKRLNECISQLQQVELAEGLDDVQVQACWNQLRNINECRVAIRFMFKQLVQERVNHVMAESELQEARNLNISLEQVNGTLHGELDHIRSENEKQLKRSINRRRTSMLITVEDSAKVTQNNLNPNEQEPPTKRQKYSDRVSDNESVISSISKNSRMSNRLIQQCRCKNGCKPTRCGCLKSSDQCSSKCLCKGLCMANLPDIMEDISESSLNKTIEEWREKQINHPNDSEKDETNAMDTTLISDSVNELNRSFTFSKGYCSNTNIIIPNIDDEDKENNMNLTTNAKKECQSQKKYFESLSLFTK